MRPKTTADLWDSRVAAVPRHLRIAAYRGDARNRHPSGRHSRLAHRSPTAGGGSDHPAPEGGNSPSTRARSLRVAPCTPARAPLRPAFGTRRLGADVQIRCQGAAAPSAVEHSTGRPPARDQSPLRGRKRRRRGNVLRFPSELVARRARARADARRPRALPGAPHGTQPGARAPLARRVLRHIRAHRRSDESAQKARNR